MESALGGVGGDHAHASLSHCCAMGVQSGHMTEPTDLRAVSGFGPSEGSATASESTRVAGMHARVHVRSV